MNFDGSTISSHDLNKTLAGDDDMLDEGFDGDFDGDMLMADVGDSLDDIEEPSDDIDDLITPPKRSSRSRKKGAAKPRAHMVAGLVDSSKLDTPKAQQRAWQKLAEFIDNAEVVPYSPKATLTFDSVVHHAKFGRGIVVSLESPQKAVILFEDQVRRLVCNRGEARPARRAVAAI